MCDECSYCCEPAWKTGELRLTPDESLLVCCDCWDAPDWDELQTLAEANEEWARSYEAMLDDKAHAHRDRRMGL